jgi:uncharacterized membrane protein
MQLMIIDVPSRERGLQVLDRVEEVADVENVSVRDVALVYRADDGRTKYRPIRDLGIARGSVEVGGLGAMLGVLAGTPTVTAAGASAGTTDAGPAAPAIDESMMDRVERHVDEAKAVVVVLAEDETIDVLSATPDLTGEDVEYVGVASHATGAAVSSGGDGPTD